MLLNAPVGTYETFAYTDIRDSTFCGNSFFMIFMFHKNNYKLKLCKPIKNTILYNYIFSRILFVYFKVALHRVSYFFFFCLYYWIKQNEQQEEKKSANFT